MPKFWQYMRALHLDKIKDPSLPVCLAMQCCIQRVIQDWMKRVPLEKQAQSTISYKGRGSKHFLPTVPMVHLDSSTSNSSGLRIGLPISPLSLRSPSPPRRYNVKNNNFNINIK